jgi:hypothetical protein
MFSAHFLFDTSFQCVVYLACQFSTWIYCYLLCQNASNKYKALQLLIFDVFIILGHHNIHKGSRPHHGDKYNKYNGE